MATVLVTGATGFIGRHVLTSLLARGHSVHTVGSRMAGPQIPGITHHQGNLLDSASAERVIAGVRAERLLHFAWFVKPGEYLGSPDNLRWVQASLDILGFFRESGGTRAVLAGTCFEYDLQRGFLIEDVTPCRPTSYYGVCKNALRELVTGYPPRDGLSTAWARIFFLYGPHENASRLVASVMNSLLRGEEAKCSHGLQIRDFLHVQDVADAFVALLDSGVTGTVNVASGQPVSLRDIIYKIAALLDRHDLVRLGVYPVPDDDPPVILGDTRKLRKETGWSPAITLDAGLARTLDWWKQQLRVDPSD